MSDSLEEALARQIGFMRRKGWDVELRRALANVAQRHRLPSLSDPELVAQRSPLVREVAEELAVSESYFFRGMPQLVEACALASEVVSRGRVAKVWSAGCARGEEPYSLLALLVDQFPVDVARATEISGTDLSRDCIEQAGRGVYTEWSLRGMPEQLRTRHFDVNPDHSFSIKPHLRGGVQFNRATIQEHLLGLPNESLDVILFRNVGIYLNEDTNDRILGALASKLRRGGLLLMAPTDPLPSLMAHPSLFSIGVGIYERRLARDGSLLPWPLSHRPEKLSASLRPPAPATTVDDSSVAEALALADRGELSAAKARLDSILFRDSGNLRARFARGQVLLASEQFRAALDDFAALGAHDDSDVIAQYYQSLCHAALGDAARAVDALTAISRTLSALPSDQVVADGCTRGDLLDAVRSELRRLT